MARTAEVGVPQQRAQVDVQLLAALLHEVDGGAVEEDALRGQPQPVRRVPARWSRVFGAKYKSEQGRRRCSRLCGMLQGKIRSAAVRTVAR